MIVATSYFGLRASAYAVGDAPADSYAANQRAAPNTTGATSTIGIVRNGVPMIVSVPTPAPKPVTPTAIYDGVPPRTVDVVAPGIAAAAPRAAAPASSPCSTCQHASVSSPPVLPAAQSVTAPRLAAGTTTVPAIANWWDQLLQHRVALGILTVILAVYLLTKRGRKP